jgi:hypothetical protein
MVGFFSSNPFYSSNIVLPTADTPISSKNTNDPRFRFFSDCIGAVDEMHIHAFLLLEEHPNMRNRKGFISQNCLFTCDFNLLFMYALTGWDGTTADTTIWHNTRTNDLYIPQGKYFLADAGFGGSDTLLMPHRGVRYHLKEWHQANLR